MFLFRRKQQGSATTVASHSGILTSSFSFGSLTSPPDLPKAEQEVDQPYEDCDRYKTIDNVNSGSFGLVQVALDRVTGQHVALKLIERGSKVSDNVENEILIMRRLNHFHTVKLKQVILTQRYLGIVMEYCSAGDMYQFVMRSARGLEESAARWFFQQMVIAVDYSHKMGIVHRDIKLRNMVLHEVGGRYLLKLCDFGFSKDNTRQSLCKTRLGTLEYMAPELLQPTSKDQLQYDGAKVDIWSLGVALFFMLVKSYPFSMQEGDAKTMGREYAIMKAILDGPILIPSFVSEPCRDLLARMLLKDPLQRCSIADVLQHPFFRLDLPQGAAAMNDNPLLYQIQPGLQEESEIRSICQQARRVLGKRLTKQYSGLDELDVVIDDEIGVTLGPDYDPLRRD